MRKILISAGIAAALAPGVALATDGYFSHGYGMKSIGMGGVGIALPQDALAPATNPAGLTMVGNRLDIGLDWFRPTRGADIVNNGAGMTGSYDGNDATDFLIPEFGYSRMLNPDMAVGIAVYGNGGMNTKYKSSPFAAVGGTSPTGVDLTQLFVAPTVAYKVNAEQLDRAVAQSRLSAVRPERAADFGLRGVLVRPDALLGSGQGFVDRMGRAHRLDRAGLFHRDARRDVPVEDQDGQVR